MNENRIIQLINNPESLNISDDNYIKWELEKYPFVQSFHYLHVKWKLRFSLQESIDEIEKLSVYSTHRELVKEMVDHTEKNSINFEGQITNKDIEQEEIIELAVSDEDLKREADNNSVAEEINVITDEMKTESVHNTSEEIEEGIRNSVINNNNQEEETSENVEQEEKNKKDQININKLGLSYLFTSGNDEKKSPADLEHIKNISPLEIEKEEMLAETQFTDLDMSVASDKSENNVASEEENKQEETINKKEEDQEQQNNLVSNITTADEKLTFNQWLSLSKNTSNHKEERELDTSNKKSQKNIIEEFIENNPKITPPKKAGKSRQELDFKKEEIKDIANLMTITLAQLYVEQGRYDTAITAYKILSLKYPEKSSYFALEIKKIKKLKNSK